MRPADGFLHSVQTLGAHDGPGLRFVAFLQGCPMRCRYCHNPDTWPRDTGRRVSAEALVARAMRYRPYFGAEGGLTLSGGEPLCQVEFSTRVLRAARGAGLHTCVDTSGYRMDPQVRTLYDQTDLVLLDVKHADPVAFRALTGRPMDGLQKTLAYFRDTGRPVWLRQVCVPGLTDSPAQIEALARLVRGLRVERVELLPYHRMGVPKWEKLSVPYPMVDTPVPPPKEVRTLEKMLRRFLEIPSQTDGGVV